MPVPPSCCFLGTAPGQRCGTGFALPSSALWDALEAATRARPKERGHPCWGELSLSSQRPTTKTIFLRASLYNRCLAQSRTFPPDTRGTTFGFILLGTFASTGLTPPASRSGTARWRARVRHCASPRAARATRKRFWRRRKSGACGRFCVWLDPQRGLVRASRGGLRSPSHDRPHGLQLRRYGRSRGRQPDR